MSLPRFPHPYIPFAAGAPSGGKKSLLQVFESSPEVTFSSTQWSDNPSPKTLSEKGRGQKGVGLEMCGTTETMGIGMGMGTGTQMGVEMGIVQLGLTSHLQRGIPAGGFTQVVPGHADIDALVRLAAAAVHNAEEEEGAAGQQHAVGAGVLMVRLHALSVFVPLHGGRRAALRPAAQRGRLTPGHQQVRGVLHDAGCGVLQPRVGAWGRVQHSPGVCGRKGVRWKEAGAQDVERGVGVSPCHPGVSPSWSSCRVLVEWEQGQEGAGQEMSGTSETWD